MIFRETQINSYLQGRFSEVCSSFPLSDILCVTFQTRVVYPIALFPHKVDRIGKYQKSIHYVLLWDLKIQQVMNSFLI